MEVGPALPVGPRKRELVRSMFDRIAPRYDRLNRLLTFRLDVGWRRKAVQSLGSAPGGRVLDVACGTGDLCEDLRAAGHDPVGLDFSAGMLAAARTAAPLVRGDALALPMPDGTFDALTCGFALRNFTALPPVLGECARVLRSGGSLALLDVAEPANRVARAGHAFYFRRVVPFVGGLLSDRQAYAYLPASTSYLPPPSELVAMITAAGFHEVRRRPLGAGAAQLLTGRRA